MSDVKLDTGFNIEIILPITPFHKRLFAWIIDAVIQGVYLFLFYKLIEGIAGDTWTDQYSWIYIIYFMPMFLYHLISEIVMNGQSPGKKALGIKVITIEGGQPSVSQYIIRWAFKVIDFPFWLISPIQNGSWPPWIALFLFSGLACIFITKTSQRIGDLLAGTVLIDTKNNTSWQDTVFMEVEDNYQPVFPQVMQLSDRDINTIKQVVSSASMKFDNRQYAERVALKIQHALKIETTADPVDFMELLLKDYNYLSAKG
jgi:uncharacterized RDD family membrane protein YckC